MTETLTPSTYQQDLYNFVEHGEGSAVVIAVAGSGKTTSILQALTLIKSTENVQLFAFNTAIAGELRERIPRHMRHVSASTFHSVGYRALCNHFMMKAVETNSRKLQQLCREKLKWEDRRRYESYICKLVDLAKGMGIGCLLPDDWGVWEEIVAHHDLYLDDPQAKEETAIQLARELLLWSTEAAESNYLIDFSDQLYLTVLWNLPVDRKDWVFVDEAQDTNPIRRALVKRVLKPNGRLVAVGDPKQCQPTGTLVEKVIKAGRFGVKERRQVRIETLKIGDYVSAYSFKDARVYARKILNIQQRPYSQHLITATSPTGAVSRYTPNHRCVVRFRADHWAVYLMQRGKNYRVGLVRCQNTDVGPGPLLRLREEDADAVWILETHPTRRAAHLAECRIAAQQGLPQLMFTSKRARSTKCILTQAELDSVWSGIANGEEARRCLHRYGRLPEHPYFVRGQQQGTFRRPHETAAANLLPGSEMLARDGAWVPVHLARDASFQDVYSLQVEKEETYFADGLLTHNSIYGFTGASIDAIDLIRREWNCIELPLSVSYRCPRAVVKQAQMLVPYIEPAPGAAEGLVGNITERQSFELLTKADAVLCRNNAPLVDYAYKCLSKGMSCQILGRDIGKGLQILVDKMQAADVEDLIRRLGQYRTREMARLLEKDQHGKAQSVDDRVQCLWTLIDNLPENERTLQGLGAALDRLFGDETGGRLTLSTVHKAKGREWPQVAILKPDLMPAPWAKVDWEEEQETHVQYVAWTRARQALYFIYD